MDRSSLDNKNRRLVWRVMLAEEQHVQRPCRRTEEGMSEELKGGQLGNKRMKLERSWRSDYGDT